MPEGKEIFVPLVPEWDRTKRVQGRVASNQMYEEPDGESRTGHFKGRRIIGRDTPIQGGVYVGAGEREAIIVDETVDWTLTQTFEELLADIERRIEEKGGRTFKNQILDAVFDLVRKKMPSSQSVVDKIATDNHLEQDRKIDIGFYILANGGVCRHQALLGAYLLERAIREKKIRGNVSVDRNSIPGRGGHAWESKKIEADSQRRGSTGYACRWG